MAQHSQHFSTALQELKDLRPHLYSAADYCESSYLCSDQKQAVLENLKSYSVKALVNAIDHIGTVACELNEFLSQQTTEISSVEVQVACLAQRLRAYREWKISEGLKQHQRTRNMQRYLQHYIFSDFVPGIQGKADEKQLQALEEPLSLKQPESVHHSVGSASNIARSLSWHLAVEASSNSNGSMPRIRHTKRSASSNYVGEKLVLKGAVAFSLSGGLSPQSNASFTAPDQAPFLGSSRSLVSLLSLDKNSDCSQTPPRKKSFLSSFLSRNRIGKTKEDYATTSSQP